MENSTCKIIYYMKGIIANHLNQEIFIKNYLDI